MLGAAIAGATLDPERLLWVPGKKLISIPKVMPAGVESFDLGDIITIAGRYVVNPRTLELLTDLQHFVITGKSQSGLRLDVFPHIDAVIAPQDIKRVDRLDMRMTPVLWSTEPA